MGMQSTQKIPVIDIFAGPGGLAEGFGSNSSFEIRLSIEKDPIAHKTLELRSFVRAFERGKLPEKYYQYVRGEITKAELFSAYPVQAKKAVAEAWCAELGKVSPQDLHQRIDEQLRDSRHWVLIGGPPCQAYSLVGRSRMTGLGLVKTSEKSPAVLEQLKQEKLLKFNSDHRHTLYKEYLKIVAVHQPSLFVMENVKGILSSKHADQLVFNKILDDLRDPWKALASDPQTKSDALLHKRRPSKSPGYRIYSCVRPVTDFAPEKHLEPEDFIIRSEEYGVPQKRHRVILLGVRNDCPINPEVLKPILQFTTVKDVINDLPALRGGLSKIDDTDDAWYSVMNEGIEKLWNQTKIQHVLEVVRKKIFSVKSRGSSFKASKRNMLKDGSTLRTWLSDSKLNGVLQHETRGHMQSDLWRYLYASSFASVYNRSPGLEEFPKKLLPEHKNIYSSDRKVTRDVAFRDRFRVQLDDQPATTITSHISKDGHYYIHYDPAQCRSLTVREAARIQTFPDNYFFEGNRTQQYHQIGNAVPPYLAWQLSKIISKAVQKWIEADKPRESARKATYGS